MLAESTKVVIVTGNLIYQEIPTSLQKIFKDDLGTSKIDIY